MCELIHTAVLSASQPVGLASPAHWSRAGDIIGGRPSCRGAARSSLPPPRVDVVDVVAGPRRDRRHHDFADRHMGEDRPRRRPCRSSGLSLIALGQIVEPLPEGEEVAEFASAPSALSENLLFS